VTRFLEVLADTSLGWDHARLEGAGLRSGSSVLRQGRVQAGVGKGEITIKAELYSKGFGQLLEAICGSISHTLVSAATYQQWGRAELSTPFRPSYTWQLGIPRSDASGTVDAYTYSGCVAKSFEIDAPSRGIPTLSVTFWCASLATATALATASYPATPTVFGDASSLAGATFGGALTVPTTTAFTAGGTAATNIRAWNFTGDLTANERPALGTWQKPTAGDVLKAFKLKLTQDYDATTTRALQLSQAATSFTGYYTGAALGISVERFELAIPSMVLDDGALPEMTTGEGSIPEPEFTVTSNGTDAAWYLVTRTSDTTL
jgi:hypothetical protein